ncbi:MULTISPECIES: hypothetical protein [unclassified Sphingomonas]|uniref:hypothetical protein n=1 Tax=Novosphingobium rhizosphaerae TaxID=1551649 RepID=UPI0015CA45FA
MAIVHLVLFAECVPLEAARIVHNELIAAHSLGDISFDLLRLAEQRVITASDGVYLGAIATGQTGRRPVLMVHLSDQAALKAYYEAPAHSRIRQAFLSSVSHEIATLYAAAERDIAGRARLYEAIEAHAARYMQRLDLFLGADSTGGTNGREGRRG